MDNLKRVLPGSGARKYHQTTQLEHIPSTAHLFKLQTLL